MTTNPSSENPWDWLGPQDVKRFGDSIMDPAERSRWCRAVLICGLPYLWRHKAGPFRELMYAKLGLKAGDKVLLISEDNEGCGFDYEIRAFIGTGGELVSIDIQEQARTTSSKGIKGRGGRVGTWKYDYVSQYPDGHFDCVAIIQAVQHADDWREAGQDLLRVLKPGHIIMLAEIGVSQKTREIAEHDLHLEYWLEKLYNGTGRRGPEDVSYYGPDELLVAFDGLLNNPSTFHWRGADLFWGTKL
jgi:SAM-dependent methyltransferase